MDPQMTSMNVSLPELLRKFIEAEVARGGYSSASEYIRELIREDQRRKSQDEIEAKLLAGLNSPARVWTKEERKTVRERIERRLARGGGKAGAK